MFESRESKDRLYEELEAFCQDETPLPVPSLEDEPCCMFHLLGGEMEESCSEF